MKKLLQTLTTYRIKCTCDGCGRSKELWASSEYDLPPSWRRKHVDGKPHLKPPLDYCQGCVKKGLHE